MTQSLHALKWLLMVALSCFACVAFAQTPTPTAEQLDAFQKLTPEQQRAVVEAMSGTADSGQTEDPTDLGTRKQDNTAKADKGDVSDTRSRLSRDQLQDRELPRELKITGRSTLILLVDVRKEDRDSQPYTDVQAKLLSDRRTRIAAGNPYVLDGEARLTLPLLPPIPLGDLTDKQAAQRLNADPRLEGLHFAVTVLPIKQTGQEALKPFGYDLFKQGRDRFEPPRNIGAPADYAIGPGDNISVELFGKKNGRYRLVVNREGAITIPDFGPIQVSGLTFDQVRTELERRVSQQMIGVRVNIAMGELRSMRIFVVGDVLSPGSHALSGLSTITAALFASGGVSDVGSLRNIELKRRGRTITKFDLYDVLLRGDTSNDLPLEQGDAIFVPPLGLTAGVMGEVRRPAIYEFREGATVGELVQFAGGAHPTAALRAATLERISPAGERVAFDVDLSSASDRQKPLQAGDVLTVPKVLDEIAGSITLEGHVHRPGSYAWRTGVRLTDVLGSLEALRLNADQRYILIRRQRMPDRRVEAISADAVAAFAAPGSKADPLLEKRDRIVVFSREPDRGAALASVLQDMRLQARDNAPAPVITVGGRVRAPGDYPLETNMTVNDAVRAGGGLDDAAYPESAELTRYEVLNGVSRKTEVIEVKLKSLVAGDTTPEVMLRPYDVVTVKELPDWRDQEFIMLQGEVRFPGRYPVRKGETLSSVIERAGGLTDSAYAEASVFTREEIKEQERAQIDTLAKRMQTDLGVLALQGSQSASANANEALAAGQTLLAQLKETEPTGRLVIDLKSAMAHKGSDNDLQIRNDDRLIVPRIKQYVSVIGEVQNVTSHVWRSGLSRDDYIALSGGTTQRADKKRIYVVRANGSVVASHGARWFSGEQSELQPGDSVVVPLDAERMRPLPLWTAVTTIIYNIAVSLAAIGSF